MAIVKFTPNLKRYFPDLQEVELEGTTVAQIVREADARWQGIADYIVNEHGALRKHVNIFVNEDMLQDRQSLSDRVEKNTKLYIMQALSGG